MADQKSKKIDENNVEDSKEDDSEMVKYKSNILAIPIGNKMLEFRGSRPSFILIIRSNLPRRKTKRAIRQSQVIHLTRIKNRRKEQGIRKKIKRKKKNRSRKAAMMKN